MYFTRTEKNEFTNEKFVSTISSETAIEEMRDLFHSCDFDYCKQKCALFLLPFRKPPFSYSFTLLKQFLYSPERRE